MHSGVHALWTSRSRIASVAGLSLDLSFMSCVTNVSVPMNIIIIKGSPQPQAEEPQSTLNSLSLEVPIKRGEASEFEHRVEGLLCDVLAPVPRRRQPPVDARTCDGV